MKGTSIVRKVDELGRLVIPIELRRKLDIEQDDGLEVFTDENGRIILRKYEPACLFCGNYEGLTVFRGKKVCDKCLDAMNKQTQDS